MFNLKRALWLNDTKVVQSMCATYNPKMFKESYLLLCTICSVNEIIMVLWIKKNKEVPIFCRSCCCTNIDYEINNNKIF